jgi:hypothetical protein
MKHAKLIRATLGAGLLVALSGTAALAHTAGEQTHVSVAVAPDTESIALVSSCVMDNLQDPDCSTAFDVDGSWTRNDTNKVLDNQYGYTQHLDYVTDWAFDTIYVAAAAIGESELANDSVTLWVLAGAPSDDRAGEFTGMPRNVGLSSTEPDAIVWGINGTEARVDASIDLSFEADVRLNADIATHTFTLTYSLEGIR